MKTLVFATLSSLALLLAPGTMAQTRAVAPSIDAFADRIERTLPALAAELLAEEDLNLFFQALRGQLKAAQTGQAAQPLVLPPDFERRMQQKAERIKADALPLLDEVLGALESEIVGFSRELKRESEKRR
jgi:phage/plasmid primase-like uncharacterized protein